MQPIVKKIEKITGLEPAISDIFNKFGLKLKGNIFIKPNLSARPPIERGENTSVEFAEALVKALLNFSGIKKIIIGHSPLLGTADRVFTFEELITSSGFINLKKISNKVELLNLDDVKRCDREANGFKFKIPEMFFNGEIDFFINIGALKTHMETTVSLALKNQMGLLTAPERQNCHKSGELEEKVASIAKMIKPDFNFIDGIWGMEGNGPHHGQGVNANLIIAGDDIVEVDSLACELVGIKYDAVNHIKIAHDTGVGEYISPEIVKKYSGLKIKFASAQKYEKFGKNIYVWPTDGCSKCITALNESGKRIKKRPFKNWKFILKAYAGNKKINIVIGNAKNLELNKNEKIIAVGNCPVKSGFCKDYGLESLDRCPPTIEETFDYLSKKIK